MIKPSRSAGPEPFNQNFKSWSINCNFLGTKLAHCAMHAIINIRRWLFQKERVAVVSWKYWVYILIWGPGGKINTPFCGKKVDTNTKTVKIEKNTREHSRPENLKKSRPKKLVKSNKSISQKNFLTKIHFFPFQKWPKFNFWTGKTAKNAISRKKFT